MQENTKSMAVRTPCCSKIGLNRGPWSPEEDILLSHYIQAFGEGRWRTLPKKAGLRRCGKSCRLRWMNYLRPDVKRGYISPEEEDLILRLHRLLGNRWSLIAGRIPGRTDNEIKNYWNTHLSKQLISQGIDPRTHKPLPESRIETSANCNTGTPENSDMTPKPSGQESQPLQPDQTEVITNKTLKKCPESVGTGLNKDQYTTNNHIGSNDVHLPRKKYKPDNAVDLFRTCTLTQPPHVIASPEAINYYEGMADMIQWKSRSKASQAMGSSTDHMTPFMFHDLFPSTIPLPFIESEKGVSILQVSSSTSVLNNLSININNESCDPGLLGHNRSPYWMNNHVMNFDMPLNTITVSGGSQVADLYGDYNGQIGHSATPPTSKSEYNVLYEGNQLSSPSLGVGNFDLSKVHRRHHHVIQKEENFMLPAEENAMVANQANNSSNMHHMGPMVANQANNSSSIHHMGPMVANQANNSSNVHHIVQIPPDGNSDLYSSYFVDSIAHEDLLNINNTNNNPASSFATSTSQALQLRLEPETPNLSYDLWSLPQYHPYV